MNVPDGVGPGDVFKVQLPEGMDYPDGGDAPEEQTGRQEPARLQLIEDAMAAGRLTEDQAVRRSPCRPSLASQVSTTRWPFADPAIVFDGVVVRL